MRTALLLSAAVLIAGAVSADEEVTHPFSKSISRDGIKRVIVDIPAGEVRLRNSSGDRIAISGESRREYDGHRERAKEQRIVDDIGAEIFTNGDEALIRRSYGPNAQSWSARSWHSNYRITVEVPRGMDVDIETRYGELSIEGDFGNLNADLRAGEIRYTSSMPRCVSAKCIRISEWIAKITKASFPGARTSSTPADARASISIRRLASCTSR
jgi:hypothetical protein